MFAIIRLLIGCAICGGCFAWIQKSSTPNKRRKCIICVVATVALLATSSIFPPENVLWPFDSPTAAYQYIHPGKDDIKLIVNGKTCDLVIGGNEITDEFQVIPKSSDGWGVDMGMGLKRIKHISTKSSSVSVYQYKDTSDYFVVAYNIDSSSALVSDSVSSEFVSFARPNTTNDGVFYVHYANVQGIQQGYTITLNGESVTVFE